jgi:glycosyltransferase involved in cell wall biosynthesis
MNKQTKILYISKDRHPSDIRTEKITESFKESGFDVTILCRWHSQDSGDNYKGINIIRAGVGSFLLSQPVPYNPIWRAAIKRTIKKIKPDLIIVREIMLALDAAKYAKKFNIPIIMDMAENYPVVMRGWDKYKKNFLIRYLVHDLKLPDKIEKASVGKMDVILTVCEEQNERLISQYNYPENKLEIVYNTPKKQWFHDVKRGILLKPTVFAYHGLINSERNLENLIYAFDIAWKSNNSIKLIIAGYGELEESLKKLAKSLESNENIIFKGKFAHGQIKNLYSEMDFGVLPYRLDEHINQTISNKYFDYMGAGKPMITSLAKPMIRMNEETLAGLPIDCDNIELLADTMLQFVNEANFELLVEMSESALKSFQCHYSWDRDFERLLRYLNKNFFDVNK